MDSVRAWTTAASAAALALIYACTPREEAAPPAPAPAPAPAAPPPAPPVLGRGELLTAVAEAASAAAAGNPAPDGVTSLAGRRFTLRLPFGCLGPTPEGGAGYVYDAEKKTLKVSYRPETWTDVPWARALVGTPETEALEGFWVRRPWLRQDACPAAPSAAPEPPAKTASDAAPKAKTAGKDQSDEASEAPATPPATAETVGLVRIFEEGGSRLSRRGGRPYEATEKAESEPTPGRGGFRLVLDGRVAAPTAGPPIRCRVVSPDVRPLCLVVVDIDRVAVEDAGGRQLAEWRN